MSDPSRWRAAFVDGDVRVIRRTTAQPVPSIKGYRPRTDASVT
jgi:hypothetical protein